MRVPTQLLDYATREPVEADLFDEVTVEHFLETQREWRPVVLEAAKAMLKGGAPREDVPRHWHWDWANKESDLRVLAYSFFGISCRGKLQGLMKLETAGRTGRIPEQKGKAVIYVDYLEAAPWNIKPLMNALGQRQRFAAVGTRLIEAAVRKSQEEDFKGRLALHSLSTSERFYLDVCSGSQSYSRGCQRHRYSPRPRWESSRVLGDAAGVAAARAGSRELEQLETGLSRVHSKPACLVER